MLLKEDGHLDFEKISKLSANELDEEFDSWGYEQAKEYREYRESLPINESQERCGKPYIEFDGTIEEFFEKFC